jgi:large subunit ribosomal protein L15
VNLSSLEKLAQSGVTTVDYAVLYEKRIIREKGKLLKILGTGSLTVAVTVLADAYSASAKSAIEKAGGQANV